MISRFRDQYRFLSNFYLHPLYIDGLEWPSAEHAYQAFKTFNMSQRDSIRCLSSPGQAKRYGRLVDLRSDWESVKVDIMKQVLDAKFKDPELRALLLSTGDHTLVEGNDHGDIFWGKCKGVGANNLGKLLMGLRSEFILNESYSGLPVEFPRCGGENDA